ncbi:cytochrome P450 [Hyaloscypha finlandica]|nr:cytochrome P450 [Hyaloscypha finlandica]
MALGASISHLGSSSLVIGSATVVAGATLTYFLWVLVYRLYFHPLARFPGPTLNAVSELPISFGVWRGKHVYNVKRWHDKHGSIVRIAPNELSFTDPAAWKDIYSSHPGRPNFPRDPIDSRFDPVEDTGVLSTDMLVADERNHARQRRTLSHAFSVKALKGQEELITEFVDLFIHKVRETTEDGKKPIDINKWYNYLTFDVIGELAFGQTFGCMATGAYNFWVSNMGDHMVAAAVEQITRRLTGAHSMLQKLMKTYLVPSGMKDHLALSTDKVSKRLDIPDSEKRDFFWYIIREKEVGNMTRAELIANAALFISAGSETTASLLAGLTHWLLKTPRVFDKLKAEIRSIEKAEDLTHDALIKMEYLNACIEEGLRIFPPVPGGNLRAVPAGGANVCGHFLPEGVTVSVQSWSVTHDPNNFPDPDSLIPERWLGQDKETISHLHASQPFSLGPRGCLGKNLAYLEMRLILGKLFWNFDMEYEAGRPEWVPLQDSKKLLAWIVWHKPALDVKLTPVARG